MTEDRNGQVVTFYSYKGGTGRTMALANVAWILAANGKRVLVVDWDLESPGLDRFFAPFIRPDTLSGTPGVIELIREFEWAATQDTNQGPSWHEEYARVHKHSFSLDWDHFPAGATLDFLSAGQQNLDYAEAITGLNWDDFYGRQGGGAFFDALRADMKRHYDYTLIDSRTGLSDVAGICSIHLPDVLVDCFTLSDQGIEGAAKVAGLVPKRLDPGRSIRILPVPMRVDPAEKGKADNGRLFAKHRFAGLPATGSEAERDAYWLAMQIPYQAHYAYEESLATFGDVSGSSGSLLTHYEILTRYLTEGEITSMPRMDESLRQRVNEQFVRRPTGPREPESDIVLQYAPADQVWAEWIEHLLVGAGVRVFDPLARRAGSEPSVPASARTLTIVSRAEDDPAALFGQMRDPYVVYVADVPYSHTAAAGFVSIARLDAVTAAERVLKLIGRSRTGSDLSADTGPRFPGTDPVVFNVQARNRRFTGREEDLRRLRSRLRSGAAVGESAVAAVLQGMPGLGKSHVAIEYAHRFRAAYDVVWWITAEPFTFIDSQLNDLATQIGVPVQAAGPDTFRAVLDALGRGEPHTRWLLIYDNAEDPRIENLLPRGQGHVVITSRNPLWNDRAIPMHLEVFERSDSVALIQKRNSNLPDEDASRVAEALGDLPIAVAAAGAYLADTGTPVDQYLEEIERQGPSVIPLEESSETVAAAWNLSLQRLTPAARRLLELCSVMASEIALDLAYSDAVAPALTKLDPLTSDRIVRGRLVQQMNRLALLRVDQRGEATQPIEHGDRSHGGQIIVHRLLQAMVRAQMSPDGLNNTRHELHLMLAQLRPDGVVADPETWTRFRMLWPHVEVSGAVECPDQAVRRLVIDRVRYLWLRGDLERGRQRAERADEAWTRHLEATDSEVTRTSTLIQLYELRFNHANILRSLGRFAESRAMNEAVLAAQVDLLGPEHPHALLTAGSLAADLRGLGLYAEALKRDVETYKVWLDSWGDDQPQTLAALNNLAVSHRLMGQYREARERDQLAYDRRKVVLGESNPYTLLSATNLGRDLRDTGDYERSILLLRMVADTTVRLSGPQSREAAMAMANLAVSLRTAGRADEAAGLLDEATELLRDAGGRSNPDLRVARLSRALNLMARRQYDRAGDELHAVHDEYTENLGPAHPHTVVCAVNLALVERANKQTYKATEMTRAAAEAFLEALGPDHPFTLDAQSNLAICLAEQRDFREAYELMTGTLEQIARVYGVDHPVTLRARINLSLMNRELTGDDSGQHVGLLDELTRALGDKHPAVTTLRQGTYMPRTIDPHPF
jgi:tetratricopeptide (TPR) repeat protein